MKKPYQEEEGSVFESDGVLYDLNKIFSAVASEPIQYININEIEWVLEYSKEYDKKRIDSVDLSIPILITKCDNRELVVDGEHRLQKAVLKKVAQLPYRRVSEHVMKSAIIEHAVKKSTGKLSNENILLLPVSMRW